MEEVLWRCGVVEGGFGCGIEVIGFEDVMMFFVESFGRVFLWCLRFLIGFGWSLEIGGW